MKITKKIQDAKLEEIFTVLQRIISQNKTAQRWEQIRDNPDGTKQTVIYDRSLNPVYRSGNKLTWQEHYYTIVKDTVTTNITVDGLSFEGMQVGTAVILDIECLDNWQELVNNVMAELPKYEYFPANLDAPTVDTLGTDSKSPKVETPKTRKGKNKIPDMPTKPADAYQWVLAWEQMEHKIENDPTLKIDYHEIREYLKSFSIDLKEDTLRKIMKRGRAKKIPSRVDFERKNKM